MTKTRVSTANEDDVDRLIWHYTDVAGAKGIIESGTIYATDSRFLNDGTELSHGWNILRPRLHSRLGPETLEALFGVIDDPSTITIPTNVTVYVSSFSTDNDSLSQWRDYGSFALGFSRRALPNVIPNGPLLLAVSYDDDEKQPVTEANLRAIAANLAQLPTHPTIRSNHLRAIRLGLVAIAASFKDASFSGENEWRLVSLHDGRTTNATRFRAGRYVPIPYIHIEIASALREVRIGPSPQQGLARLGVEDLLATHKRAGVRVTTSPIPFQTI